MHQQCVAPSRAPQRTASPHSGQRAGTEAGGRDPLMARAYRAGQREDITRAFDRRGRACGRDAADPRIDESVDSAGGLCEPAR
jgi:hypothetical protein